VEADRLPCESAIVCQKLLIGHQISDKFALVGQATKGRCLTRIRFGQMGMLQDNSFELLDSFFTQYFRWRRVGGVVGRLIPSRFVGLN
jgi:hypothetical protein